MIDLSWNLGVAASILFGLFAMAGMILLVKSKNNIGKTIGLAILLFLVGILVFLAGVNR